MQAFLDEIENIDLYPHLCNEQMASKVKALLSKKRIYTLFGRKFKDDDKVTNLLRKLAANQNDGKLWGWWNRGTDRAVDLAAGRGGTSRRRNGGL